MDMTLIPPSINKFYVVNDAYRGGFRIFFYMVATYLENEIIIIADSQEYADILAKNSTDPYGLTTGNTLKDILSTMNTACVG